jgi:UDP-N-acetylmuramate dehydrogenase
MLPAVSKDLTSLNTFGLAAVSPNYLAVKSVDELRKWCKNPHEDEWMILGGGSNVLFVDAPKGTILHMQIPGIRTLRENDDFAWVEAGSGVIWHDLVLFALEKNLGGIENLALIPGQCGAAPMQNIGAYGVELNQVFDYLEVVNLKTGGIEIFSNASCGFGYRTSVFKTTYKNKFAITKIVLKLSKKPALNTSYGSISQHLLSQHIWNPGIRDVARAVIEIRQSKLPDPAQTGNAGSFFKNPVITKAQYSEILKSYSDAPGYEVEHDLVKIPAGWLIEKCGWKGKRMGNAGTWHQQALVIVNHGGATGAEILSLARTIRDDVFKTFSIELQPEVNLVGMNQDDF